MSRSEGLPSLAEHFLQQDRSPKRKHAVAGVKGDQMIESQARKGQLKGPRGESISRRRGHIPHCPLSKKAVVLLKQWVKDIILQLPPASSVPTPAEERDPNFCSYHRQKSYTLEQCFVFRKIFNKKLKHGEIILQGKGARNVHERSFPSTKTRAKATP